MECVIYLFFPLLEDSSYLLYCRGYQDAGIDPDTGCLVHCTNELLYISGDVPDANSPLQDHEQKQQHRS